MATRARPVGPETGTPPYRRLALLGLGVVANAVLVMVAPRHGPGSAALVAVATAACGWLAYLEWQRPRLGGGLVAAAVVVLIAVAVITPPRTSNDLWSYGTYGRMVVAHDADPYTATPSQFPHDPIARRVSRIWMHRPSVYGPVWLGVATVDAALVGSSKAGNRFFFQGIAALAASAVLLLIWRRTRSPAAVLWLGLQPAFLAVAVNGGHADLLIGLGILVAAMCAARGRGWAAGVVIGLVALIKLTALLALVGIVLWAWRARNRRVLIGAAVGSALTILIGYAPFLGDATRVLKGADHTVTAASPWNGIADLLVGHSAGRNVAHPLLSTPTLETIFYAGLVLVGLLALLIGREAAKADDPALAVGVTTAAYPLGASYSFPWYANWALPSVAGSAPAPIAWVIWFQAAAALVVLKMRDHSTGTLGDSIFRIVLSDVVPLVLLVAFVVYGLRSGKPRASTGTGEIGMAPAGAPGPAGHR
ncbi:MAG: hypothetical protein JWL73_816 [Actinomycetia bacterium]|nr:hypothetical protein [Actinomycetes bacterium]